MMSILLMEGRSKLKTDMDSEKKPLTKKEARFCYEYCIDLNATQSAIRAGYSLRSARAIGCENLTKHDIQAEIIRLRNSLEETAGVTALRIINEHKKIGFSSIGSIYQTWVTRKDFDLLTDDQKACIAEIDTKIKIEYEYDPDSDRKDKKEPVRVEYVRVKLYDKQKSLDCLTNIFGYNAVIRNELSGKIEFENLPESQLDEIIFRILNKKK